MSDSETGSGAVGSHGSAAGGAHGHPSHLAHHFSSPLQQYDSGKLGMWLFLATEILLFGGLFCVYAVYRANHPEIFAWAHHFLDSSLGALNTTILLCSSLTMAWAVRAAQLNQRKLLILMLSLTLLGGVGFLCVKYVEYRGKWQHGLLWGKRYQPDPAYVSEHFGLAAPGAEDADEAALGAGDPDRGKAIFLGTCAGCHGRDGRGIAGQGAGLPGTEFLAVNDDRQLLEFLKVGRQPFDPASKLKIAMPPRGGNPTLGDDKLMDAIAYLRVLDADWAKRVEAGEVPSGPATAALAAANTDAAEPDLLIPRSVLPPAPSGPGGTVLAQGLQQGHPSMAAPPRNVHLFFGVYFLMTGLHGVHVLAGMAVLMFLLVGALRGRFGSHYFTPVDLGGLYWHLVDLIWIFLFPLFYLIH